MIKSPFSRAAGSSAVTAFAVLASLLLPVGLHAQAATSTEAINPFNQFAKSSEGVNLYSGDAYVPLKLHTLAGRSGMDVNLELVYSSNVFMNVLARNDKAPTDWLGLGWRLKVGATIVADHMNTTSLEDDEWVYTSAEGVTGRILKAGVRYFLEKEPYWKVVPNIFGGNRILGWTLTDPDGKAFRFGDHAAYGQGARNATRYSLAWEGATNNNTNHVGEGLSGAPTHYPFQWDLAEIEDLAGNKIRYEYDQRLEALKYNGWNSGAEYTKASYLRRITNPEGATVLFERRTKTAGELFDPKDFSGEEPDAFIEFYEDQLLEKIQVRSPGGTLIREFEACYKKINTDAAIPRNYEKSLLVRIFERDGVVPEIGRHEFEYYDDAAKRSAYIPTTDEIFAPDYNFGALKSIQGQLCGKTVFEYAKTNVSLANKVALSESFDSEDMVIKGSILGTGEEYIVFLDEDGILKVYNWNGGSWKAQDIYKPNGTDIAIKFGGKLGECCSTIPGGRMPSALVAQRDYFVVIPSSKKDPQGNYRTGLFLTPFAWDGRRWIMAEIDANPICSQSGKKCDQIQHTSFQDLAIIAHTSEHFIPWNPDALPDCSISGCGGRDGHDIFPLWSYRKTGTKFTVHQVTSNHENVHVMNVATEGNSISFHYVDEAELPGNDARQKVYTWNGASWSKTIDLADRDRDDTHILEKDFFAEVEENGFGVVGHRANAWNWSGKDWIKTLNGAYLDSWKVVAGDEDATSSDIQAHGNGYFVARYNDKDELKVFQWTGHDWKSKVSTNIVNSDLDFLFEAYWRGTRGPDFFVAAYPRIYWSTIPVCYWWGKCWDVPYLKHIAQNAKVRAYHWDNRAWTGVDFGTLGYPNSPKRLKAGADMFVYTSNPGTSQVWNGERWLTEKRDNRLSENIQILSKNVFAEISGSKLIVHHKFQNSTVNPTYSFVVRRRTLTDPVTGAVHSFRYEYAPQGSGYDTRNGTAKFNKVTVHIPDHGSEVSYFFNDFEDNSKALATDDLPNAQKALNPDFNHLDGLVYRRYINSVDGKRVGKEETAYEAFRDAAWPKAAYHVRKTKTASTLDGVTSVRNLSVNPGNGLPGEVVETNSDGRRKRLSTLYAFQVPSYAAQMGPDGRNMIRAVAGTMVREDLDVKSATATTWVSGLGNSGGAPRANRSLVWNPPAGGAAYQEYDYAIPPTGTNTHWVSAGTKVRYDATGNVIETTTPKGVPIATIFGRSGSVESAECAGADRAACAVFTGDYDENVNDQFDDANDWNKGGSSLSQTMKHFGTASIHVRNNQSGPHKSMPAGVASKTYVFSAWVYAVSVGPNSPVHLAVFRGSQEVLPLESKFGLVPPGNSWGWRKISRTIPGTQLGSAFEIRVSSFQGAEFFVDDIRFHPVDAHVTTQYYHPDLRLPVGQVSPGDKAEYTEYDAAGRITALYRENEAGGKIKIHEISYANLKGCSMGAPLTGRLAKVSVSEGILEFNPGTRTYSGLIVPNAIEKLLVEFQPENPEEQVSTKIGSSDYQANCCNTVRTLAVPLGDGATTFRLKVGSAEDYVFTVTRLSTCWSTAGAPASANRAASSPSLAFQASQPYVAFQGESDGLLYVRKLEGGAWTDVGAAVSSGQASDAIIKLHQGIPYIAFRDRRTLPDGAGVRDLDVVVVKRLEQAGWTPVGRHSGAVNDGIASKGQANSLSFDIATDGTPWLSFAGDPAAEENLSGVTQMKEIRSYVKKLEGGLWVRVGSPLTASRTSLAIAGGVPHIAYIGTQVVDIPPVGGQPASQVQARSIFVKKLRTIAGAQEWGSPYDGAGAGADLTLGELIGAVNPKSVKLTYDGTRLYLAYDHEFTEEVVGDPDEVGNEYRSSGTRVLSVREFRPEPASGGSTPQGWVLLPEGPTEADSRILVVDDLADYALSVQSGVPQIAFSNAHSGFRVTAIRYQGGRWSSIGIPGFAQGSGTSDAGNTALGLAADGTLFVAYRGGEDPHSDREKKMNVLRYNPGCKDPTLSEVSVRTPGGAQVGMDLGFKQYYTYYRGAVEHDVHSVSVLATPNFCNDIGAVSLRSMGTTVDAWTKSGTCANVSTLSMPLKEGANEFEVWGVDNEGKGAIRYRFLLIRKPDPNPVGLEIAFNPDLRVSPAFDLSNPGPYRLDDASFSQAALGVIAGFDPTLSVTVNGTPVGSGIETRVDLVVGANTIQVAAKMPGGTERTFTFLVNRLSQSQTSPGLDLTVLFKHAVEETRYIPVSRSADYHEIMVPLDVQSIRASKPSTNTCAVTLNGVPLPGTELPVALPSAVTLILVRQYCPDGSERNHLVSVRKVRFSRRNLVIGRVESGEPPGFYEFANLLDAYSAVHAFVNSEPIESLSTSFQFHVVPDRGETLVVPPPFEFDPFEKSGQRIESEVLGVLKDSPAYQDLLDEYNQNPVP